MLGAQGIRATGFKRAQGNAHCAKFESHTNRVTFETNAIRMASSIQALYLVVKQSCLSYFTYTYFRYLDYDMLFLILEEAPDCAHRCLLCIICTLYVSR